ELAFSWFMPSPYGFVREWVCELGACVCLRVFFSFVLRVFLIARISLAVATQTPGLCKDHMPMPRSCSPMLLPGLCAVLWREMAPFVAFNPRATVFIANKDPNLPVDAVIELPPLIRSWMTPNSLADVLNCWME
ncbi:hypothetical protein U1Q18_018708, partial [Sarracenia purpurea var. burkii]